MIAYDKLDDGYKLLFEQVAANPAYIQSHLPFMKEAYDIFKPDANLEIISIYTGIGRSSIQNQMLRRLFFSFSP